MSNEKLLERFNKEVLLSGLEGTLPQNLSDEWLEILLIQSSTLQDDEKPGRVTELVAAVLHIICAKNGLTSISISESELTANIQKYSIELAIEELRRKTSLKANKPTLNNILTNRNFHFHTQN